jgi:autophagy-related protein 9
MWRGSPTFRGRGDRRNVFSRDLTHNILGTGYQLGSLWLIDADQKNHPYLLDWYYMSQPNRMTGYSRDSAPQPSEPQPSEATKQHPGDYWTPFNLTQNEPKYEEYWGDHYGDRTQSHLGASTSTRFFQDSVLRHHDSSNLPNPTRSHWWARSGPDGAQLQTSFLEPPDFNNQSSDNYNDNFSDRISEEQEQQLDWRNDRQLSRTTYMDDLEAGELNLHFDDIYSRPPETPRINPEATSFG